MSAIDLLSRVLPILREEARSLIECCSTLRQEADGEYEPLPGTCDPDATVDIVSRLKLIRDIEVVVGKKFFGPQWLDDMIFYGIDGRPA